MRLVRLHLKQFRQHRDTAVSFSSGLSGIIGNNGAGKSSLVEAIAFALYGAKAARGRVEDIKTRGARKNSEAEVTLSFEHGGQSFRIERSTSDAKFFVGGESEPFSRGTREVSDRAGHILAMNYEEFIATYFTEQKGLEFLSGKKGATERERFIVRMMGYDKLEKAQELLRADRRDRRNEIAGWQAALGERADIEARIAAEDAGIKPLEAKHVESRNVLQQAEKEVELCKTAAAGLQERRSKYLDISSRIAAKNFQTEECRRKVSAIESELQGLGQFAAEGGGYEERERELRKRVEALKAHCRERTEKVSGLTLAWRESLAAIKSELAIKEKDYSEHSKRARELSRLSDSARCPTCEQELGQSFGQVMERHESALSEMKDSIEVKRADFSALQDEPRPIAAERTALAELEVQHQSAESELTRFQGARAQHERAARLTDELTAERAKLESLKGDLAREQAELAVLQFSENDYNAAVSKLNSCERLLEVARLQRVKLEGELDKHRALLQRSRDELAEHDRKAILLESARKELLLFEESDRVLGDFRKALNASLRPRLAELAGEFLSDLTDGRYSAVDIGQDFTPSVLEDGDAKPIISGGEEDLLNLCVRLALSQLLAERAGQTFSLLILDEVFGSLDENRRNNVLMLLEKLNSRFEQIIVITHLEDIREGVQHLLSVHYDDSDGTVAVVDEFGVEERALAANV